MGLPLNQVVPNCAPNHLRLTTLDKYRCVHQHLHNNNINPSQRRRQPPPPLVTAPRRVVHANNSTVTGFGSRGGGGGQPHQGRNFSQVSSSSCNGIRANNLLNKFHVNLAKGRLKLGELTGRPGQGGGSRMGIRCRNQVASIRSHVHTMGHFKGSVPIVSNMPLINIQNSSIVLVNDSPFGLRDKRFGILHHALPSETYYG